MRRPSRHAAASTTARCRRATSQSHRIVGTEVYIARAGDSAWTLYAAPMPSCRCGCLQQYNPDLDFAELRPGTQIVMPRVEEVSGNG